MNKSSFVPFLVIALAVTFTSCSTDKNPPSDPSLLQIPRLEKQGTTTRLIVGDKPFIILGGELGNSTFTSQEYMDQVWPKLREMNLNTILAPVYWELVEPAEGFFDFDLLDSLVNEARNHDLKIVFLWFASWKNSMSGHVPSWVKLDEERFPRARDAGGISQEILTPFSENNLQADLKAFRALMSHIRELNQSDPAIIMVQVENEIGMLPSARDYHPLAEKKFRENVPGELITYLSANREKLVPEFQAAWGKNGFKTSGTWEEVFGSGVRTDEIFMAWYFSKYANAVAEAGKEVYPLPMFVNAALNRPGAEPGKSYPSGGPLPHLMDVWLAGGKSIDFLSPDFYNPDFKHWNDLYTRRDNPLFIPEHRFDQTAAAKAAYAVGHYEAIGFAPFSIESTANPGDEDLGKMYHILGQLTPLITGQHGQGKINGVLLDKENPETVQNFGDYEFTIKHSYTLRWEDGSRNDTWEPSGAVIIQSGNNEFWVGGSGIVITFRNTRDSTLNTGILKDTEGRFENGEWKITRHLNGDQTHQGRHVRIFHGEYSIQKFTLYDYRKR